MHKQAALNTLKLFSLSAIGSIALVLAIQYMTLGTFLMTLGGFCMAYFGYTFYSMEKTRLETIEKLNSISKE